MKSRIYPWCQAAALVLAGLWVFWPALRGDWIWDDLAEVAANPVLRDPRGLMKIWFAPTGADYFPLKSTVQWLEWHLWGDLPLGYHLVNLGLHLTSALLFWRLLKRLIPGALGPWLGGLIFAIHPLTVESVAWIAELKNALSLPPLLLAMLSWVDWTEAPAGPGPSGRPTGAYARTLFWFLLALGCKTSVVMFPVVLLLFLYWKRGRIGREGWWATTPFFALGVAFGLVTLWFQERHAIVGADLAIGGFVSRAAAAGIALIFYAGKLLWPVGLIPNYPRWPVVPPSLVQFLPWAAVLALAAWLSARPCRAVGFGLGCFAVNLLPVLGFLPMAYLRISWVADHFAYLPALGLIGVAAAGAGAWLERTHGGWRGAALALAMAACAGLGLTSRHQAAIYRDDAHFWGYTVQRNPAAWLAQTNLGLILVRSGRASAALEHDQESIRLQPRYPEAHNNLGTALACLGRLPEAIAAYQDALRLQPDFLEARRNLGSALAQSGHLPEAIVAYGEAVRRSPNDALTHCYLGMALAEAGQSAAALGEYAAAVRLDPDLAEAHYRLGNALANAGRLPEAMGEYTAALRRQPEYAEARANLGLALAVQHRIPEAVVELERALQSKPAYAEGHAYLGYALAQAGRYPEAIAHYQAALRLGSGSADLHYNLAEALRACGRTREARAEFDRAAEISAGAGAMSRP